MPEAGFEPATFLRRLNSLSGTTLDDEDAAGKASRYLTAFDYNDLPNHNLEILGFMPFSEGLNLESFTKSRNLRQIINKQ